MGNAIADSPATFAKIKNARPMTDAKIRLRQRINDSAKDVMLTTAATTAQITMAYGARKMQNQKRRAAIEIGDLMG